MLAINTPFDAISAIEMDENATAQDQLRAWAYLIKSGMAWTLQGFYGRQANDLIQNGVISPEGEIDWNTYDQMMDQF